MNTISQEEFKKRYGTQGLQKFFQPPPTFTQKAGQQISGAFKSGIEQAKQGIQQVGQSQGNPLDLVEGVGRVGAGAISAATSPLAPITEPTIGRGVKYVAGKLSDIPQVQKFAQTGLGKGVARTAENVANYATIAGTVGGAMEVPKVGGAIKATTKQGIKAVGETGSKAISTVKEKISPTVPLEQQFLRDATPAFSKKLISEPPVKTATGKMPRVQEGGLIKGRTITPNILEQEAAKELAKVPNYPMNGTHLEKFQAIQPEISARGEALMTSLKNEKILRPPQQVAKVINDAIKKVPQESLLLQKSDPVIANYMRVAKNAISKTDGTLAGELKVRQLLDSAYKNARGKMAFGSDKLSALDDIHSAARDALNKDIIAKAKSTDVKASLKSQWDLMRASDVLRNKAESEAGSTISRFIQKNPITSKVIKGAAQAAGIGTGINILQ